MFDLAQKVSRSAKQAILKEGLHIAAAVEHAIDKDLAVRGIG